MATITSLPDEVIDTILRNENISLKDVVSFKCTCKKFYEMIQSKKLWEMKFYQRCPSAKKKYDVEKRKKIFDHLDFKRKIEANIKCINLLQHFVHQMSNNMFSKTDKKELGRLLISIAEDSMTYYFVLDEINIIVPPDTHLWNLDSNLANMYNFGQINSYLRQYRFIYKLNKFLNMPKEKRLFERLIIIMAQHCEPCVSYLVIKTCLDDIAHEVLSLVKNKYPKHSTFSTSLEQISFWRDNNIERNFWNREEAMQIIGILEEFMPKLTYNKFFLTYNNFVTTLSVPPKYRNKVLFNSNFLQTATYESVAKRLGIYCCTTYAEFYIDNVCRKMWKPKYNIEDLGDPYYFKYDPATSIAFYDGMECSYYDPEFTNYRLYGITNIQEIRMIMFLLYESLIYGNFLYSNFDDAERLLKDSLRVHINQWLKRFKNIEKININTEYINIIESLQDGSDIFSFERNELKGRNEPKRKNKEIKFTIGMVVKHTPQDEYFVPRNGVIIGWHPKCNRMFTRLLMDVSEWNLYALDHPFISENLYLLYKLIRIDQPCFREYDGEVIGWTDCNMEQQPHYLILTDGNEIRYVPQDTISECLTNEQSKLINNGEIGRYFTRFKGTHYVPNKKLAELYQDDALALFEILSSQ